MPLQLTPHPSLTLPVAPPPAELAPRVLAVILDREDLDVTLPVAIALATEEQRELCVAVIRPRPLWSTDTALCTLLTEEVDRQVGQLLGDIAAATDAAGVMPVVTVQLLAGLTGRDRRLVLERVVIDLAWYYAARPLGTWAA